MSAPQIEMTPKLLGSLYTEAMVLADEARSYFDRDRVNSEISAELGVAFSCESLRVTTRIMHSIAWLLGQKALHAGEISQVDANSDIYVLGYAPASDTYFRDQFPDEAQEIIAASEDLYYRLHRISGGLRRTPNPMPVPHIMVERIRKAF